MDDEYRLAEPEDISPPDAYSPPHTALGADQPPQASPSPEALIQTLRSQQNLLMGIWGGALGAFLGAGAWGAITALTGYQIGFVAMGVGFLAGYFVRVFGRGIDQHFGFIGAAWAVVGCLVGNLFSLCIMVSQDSGQPLLPLLLNIPFFAVDALKATFSVMDILFYGIALYEGYRFSFRTLTHEEVMSLTAATSSPTEP